MPGVIRAAAVLACLYATVVAATFFGSKRIGTYDRLGTAKYNPNGQPQSFYPYGEDRGTVQPNDSLKFATYTRDSATGLDYADQRYFASNFGRFMSPDPYPGSARSSTQGAGTSISTRAMIRYDPTGLDDTFSFPCVVGAGEGAEVTECEVTSLATGFAVSADHTPHWVGTYEKR